MASLRVPAILALVAACAALPGQALPPAPAATPDVPPQAAPAGAPADVTTPPTWSRFRGPDGSGVAAATAIPRSFDAGSGEGIIWRTALPLTGANSPVVWGDRVFVAGADETRREVYCLDAATGRCLWTAAVGPGDDGPPPRLHDMTGYAAATGCTDGELVYWVFPTGHLVALGMDGQTVWSRRFDLTDDIYGHASSLLTHGDLLYVQMDLGKPDIGKSHLAALNRRTGQTVWDIPRPVQGSWTTPIVIRANGREELVTSAKPWVIAYDPPTGRELWRVNCVEGDSAPSPIFANGHVYVANVYARLTAIRPGGSGDVTATHVTFSVPGQLPDITSPVSDGLHVYTLSSGGFLACYDATTGERLGGRSLGARFRSSPSLIGGQLVLFTEEGRGLVVLPGPDLTPVGGGDLGEAIYTSPACAGGRTFIRGSKHLFCLGPASQAP